MQYKIRSSLSSDAFHLHDLWEKSVRATHHFLSPEDIEAISKDVKGYFMNASFTVVVNSHNIPVAFMGMTQEKIDSLFVHPDYFGQGFGKVLIDKAKNQYKELRVDVNEANQSALKFYEKVGFKVYDRSPTDEQGRPFPILHLKAILTI